jgi:hypothetical protein
VWACQIFIVLLSEPTYSAALTVPFKYEHAKAVMNNMNIRSFNASPFQYEGHHSLDILPGYI